MKTYIFEKCRVRVENLDAKAIKEQEAINGALLGVKIDGVGYVPDMTGKQSIEEDLYKLKYSDKRC